MPYLLLLCVLFPVALCTNNNESHRRLTPGSSIINELKHQLKEGIKHPRFSITALVNQNDENNLFTSDSSDLIEIDVVLANPSVDTMTTFSVRGFNRPVQTPMMLLVADNSNTHSGDFAILSVDEKKETVSGIVQKDNKFVKLEQRRSGQTVVTPLSFDPDEDWECMLDKHDVNHDHHDHKHGDDRNGKAFKLLSSGLRHGHNLRQLVKDLELNKRQLYATDSFPNAWTYQVDFYIEVDDEFVQNHDTDTVNMPNTINYVNALVTAVSVIYEQEVDTHLNVLHIAKTSIYDSAADVVAALDIMRDTYSGDSWHYTDPTTGENPDLHHALLYRTPRAGYASVGGICDSQLGYGVSAGVQGTLDDIDGALFWDTLVFAHEVGHNFNSRHTHDMTGFNPLIDDCGNGGCNSFVTGEPVSTGEASIMSYCNKCSGGVNNMGTSFGGYWFEDNRDDIGNWNDNDALVPFGQEPKRVPKVLYDYVSTRGTCVDPYIVPDIQTCSQDEDCHDGNSCTIDTCNGNQCTNTMLDNCCGNFICEAGESECSDCGPFRVNTPSCSSCIVPYGEMFDVVAIENITLTSIDFKIRTGTNTVTLYTATDGYSDKARDADQWTQLFSGTFEVTSGTFTTVSVDFADLKLKADSVQAFYIASTGQVASLEDNVDEPLASDGRLKLLNPTRGVTETQFGSAYSNVLSWVGSMSYSIEAPPGVPTTQPSPTTSPSSAPTTQITSQPQSLPSTSPSLSPSATPSSATPSSATPSASPSASPSKSPRLSPSVSPSHNPTESPLLISSLAPTTSPSKSPSESPINGSTGSPSNSPLLMGSSSPTASPSVGNTDAPTKNPTSIPTVSPTHEVSSALPTSVSPTLSTPSPNKSTKNPTKKPSLTPTKVPTNKPTEAPTKQPSEPPSKNPTKVPTTQPSKRPSPKPTISPTKMPAIISETLIYSVDLCYPGCGNFTDDDAFEDLIRLYVPCRPKRCDVIIVAQSDQCSTCANKLSVEGSRKLQGGNAPTQSSKITFEIESKDPLNEDIVLSNLNSNITNANNELADSESTFRIYGNYAVSTAAPSLIPTIEPTISTPKPFAEKPVKIPTMKPTQIPIISGKSGKSESKSGKSVGKSNKSSGGKSSKSNLSPNLILDNKEKSEKELFDASQAWQFANKKKTEASKKGKKKKIESSSLTKKEKKALLDKKGFVPKNAIDNWAQLTKKEKKAILKQNEN